MGFIVTLWILCCFNRSFADWSFLRSINLRRFFIKDVKDTPIIDSVNDTLYLGSKVKISCTEKNQRPKEILSYSWKHFDKAVASSDHYLVEENGDLTLDGVTSEDGGAFYCLMKTKAGIMKYKHEVEVVQLPAVTSHVYFVYKVQKCTREIQISAKTFVMSKLRNNVCTSVCKISPIYSHCHWTPFDGLSVRVIVPMVVPDAPDISCDIGCSKRRQRSAEEELTKRIVETVMAGQGLKIPLVMNKEPVPYYDTKKGMICDPGFEVKELDKKTVCVPCSPGTFLDGSHCIPCHLNQYMERYAATECSYCPDNKVTRKRGAKSKEECYYQESYLTWLLIVFIALASSVIILYFCWCLKRRISFYCCRKIIDFCNCKKQKHSVDPHLESVSSMSSSDFQESESDAESHYEPTESPAFDGSKRNLMDDEWDYDASVVRMDPKASTRPLVDVTPPPPPPPAMPTDSMLKRAAKSSVPLQDVQNRDLFNSFQYGCQPFRNTLREEKATQYSKPQQDATGQVYGHFGDLDATHSGPNWRSNKQSSYLYNYASK